MAVAILEEDDLRRIIREELTTLLGAMERQSKQDDLPSTLTVEQAAKVLRVGKNKMYDLTRRPGFPAIRDGWRILIPRDALFRWLEEEAFRNTGEAATTRE